MLVQLDQILDPQNPERPKYPAESFEEPGTETVSGAKAGYCKHPLHSTSPRGWADHLGHPYPHTP